MSDRKIKCTVRDGRFVEPCEALAQLVDNDAPGFSKRKGVVRWFYTNLVTHQPSREFYGVKTQAHPNGFLFNFCPVCGTDISAPFASQEQSETAA